MAETVFSKIIRREIPADILYEDEQVIAFRDIAPMAPTHILVVPKEELATANEITAEHEPMIGHMVRIATELARQEGIDEKGYRLVMNCNSDGGQAVYHIHLHLLGGRKLNGQLG